MNVKVNAIANAIVSVSVVVDVIVEFSVMVDRHAHGMVMITLMLTAMFL